MLLAMEVQISEQVQLHLVSLGGMRKISTNSN